MDLSRMIQQTPRSAVLREEDYFVWGGSMIRSADGTYHLLYSRWPRELGFGAWVTHSTIAHAVADEPLGPYEHVDIALPERGSAHWDGHCTHNPTIAQFDNRYYLYYTGNVGTREVTDDLNFSHRNNQRIGVAVADHPGGPWERFDAPLIDPTPGFHDALCCTNPAVTERSDGSVLFVYKTVADEQERPFGGPVRHVAATADKPTGPVEKHPDPIFTAGDVDFPTEDPDVWRQDGQYWAVLKDQDGYFTDAGKSLALFESHDGIDWRPADNPLVSTPQIEWDDGTVQVLHRLERPQIWMESGPPKALFCAAKKGPQTQSFNVHIPLESPTDR